MHCADARNICVILHTAGVLLAEVKYCRAVFVWFSQLAMTICSLLFLLTFAVEEEAEEEEDEAPEKKPVISLRLTTVPRVITSNTIVSTVHACTIAR